jgi:hypothetical protein
MRQNRPYGSEVGESGSTGLPYPYRATVGYGEGPNRSHPLPSGGGGARKASTVWRQVASAPVKAIE